MTSLDHSWSGVLNRGDVKRKGLYSYDYNDRLSNVVGSFAASYEFDEIGRMSKKVEGDDGIEFSYANPSYRPSGYSVNGESAAKDVEYFKYDASGNIWYDKHNKVVYKNSELGLPVKITTFASMPSNITLEDVNEEKDFANVESVVDVTYDEAGNRLWYSVDNRVCNEKWIEVTLPGIGVFKSQDADAANPAYELVRQDLVAGAYRDASGKAHFPVLDAVSIRVTLAWLKPRSYIEGDILRRLNGGAVLPKRSFGASVQDKEFDNEHGKYYFGARYYDPFFGMWISPDPAGQFANPYSYGGDPLNYIDPTGMWALGLGLVVGYDSNHGWSFGMGAAAKIGDVGFNASLAFNQDGSKSLSLGANVKLPIQTPWVYIEINMGLGFAMNSYSGATVSTHGGVCVGEVGNCVGIDQGGGMYWDRSGGFAGMTVYAELYAQLFEEARISTGYKVGLFGAEGRGMYAGASAFGLYAEASHIEDFNKTQTGWGASYTTDIWGSDSQKGFDYIGKGLVDALLEVDEIPHKEHENFRGDKDKWGKTNYCGSGGDGGLTDGVDAGCYAHDKRYDIAYERAKQKGVPKWVRDYFYAGVGGFFSLFLMYKFPINIAIDLIYHTHPTNRYSWNASYYNR